MRNKTNPNTIKKNNLIKALSKIDGDIPVYIHCSYNTYNIKKLLISDNGIIIDCGMVDNEHEETYDITNEVFEEDF